MHTPALKIKEASDGLDFYFAQKQEARKLVNFLVTVVPCRSVGRTHTHTHTHAHTHVHTHTRCCRYKTSQELVSHDIHSNTFQYKHTFSVELVPVCKVCHS